MLYILNIPNFYFERLNTSKVFTFPFSFFSLSTFNHQPLSRVTALLISKYMDQFCLFLNFMQMEVYSAIFFNFFIEALQNFVVFCQTST